MIIIPLKTVSYDILSVLLYVAWDGLVSWLSIKWVIRVYLLRVL